MEPTLLIDDQEVGFAPGQTILEAAAAADITIPTLCYLPEADHSDVCRICVVEVDGARNLLPACSTEAQEGMRVRTESDRVVATRRQSLELLLANGWHDCWACEANGDCRLQDLAYQYNIRSTAPQVRADSFPSAPADPFIIRDYSKCVQCGRCVAACNSIQVHGAIPDPFGRREDRSPIEGWFPIQDADRCVVCGQCIEACPVGALTERKAASLGRTWETRKVRTTCPYCGVGCQQWVHVKEGRIVKVTAVADAQPNQGRLCVKGRFAYDFLESPDRLTTPLVRGEDGRLHEASWDEALDLVAQRLTEIVNQHGPDAVAGVSCARALNEDSYNMQKFFRGVIGTNNLDHCART